MNFGQFVALMLLSVVIHHYFTKDYPEMPPTLSWLIVMFASMLWVVLHALLSLINKKLESK